MNNGIKDEVIKVLSVIEDSINLNCPDQKEQISKIEETKAYIVNNLNSEEKVKIEDQ